MLIKRILLILFLINYRIILFAQDNLEKDFNYINEILEGSNDFSSAIVAIDKMFGIDTAFSRRRLSNMIRNYKKSTSSIEFERMLNIVEYLEKFYTKTSNDFRDGILTSNPMNNSTEIVLPYSKILESRKFNCVTLTFDFISLAHYEGIETYFLYLPEHVVPIAFLDGEEWVIEISSDKKFRSFARSLKRRGKVLDRHAYYRYYNRSYETFYNDFHGRLFTKYGAVVEYLLRLSLCVDIGYDDLRAVRLALKFFPDYDKAKYYLGVRYYYRKNLPMVKASTSTIKMPYYIRVSSDMIQKLETYLKHNNKNFLE